MKGPTWWIWRMRAKEMLGMIRPRSERLRIAARFVREANRWVSDWRRLKDPMYLRFANEALQDAARVVKGE